MAALLAWFMRINWDGRPHIKNETSCTQPYHPSHSPTSPYCLPISIHQTDVHQSAPRCRTLHGWLLVMYVRAQIFIAHVIPKSNANRELRPRKWHMCNVPSLSGTRIIGTILNHALKTPIELCLPFQLSKSFQL